MSSHTDTTTKTTIKQVIDRFLLSCKVDGKSYGIIMSSHLKYSPVDNLRT
jgi:hypothetical protein